MTCDWNEIKAPVETFFKRPSEYEIRVFDSFEEFILKLENHESDVKGCRLPVERTSGFFDEESKEMWLVSLTVLKETDHSYSEYFSTRTKQAELAEKLSL